MIFQLYGDRNRQRFKWYLKQCLFLVLSSQLIYSPIGIYWMLLFPKKVCILFTFLRFCLSFSFAGWEIAWKCNSRQQTTKCTIASIWIILCIFHFLLLLISFLHNTLTGRWYNMKAKPKNVVKTHRILQNIWVIR